MKREGEWGGVKGCQSPEGLLYRIIDEKAESLFAMKVNGFHFSVHTAPIHTYAYAKFGGVYVCIVTYDM